ncbi:MAG TPA: hypothetical protein VFW75_06900 [Acetobacteraceae bacterium]|nr:hypothetical protein [Acetobacteraceae bacterium]
MQGVSAAFAVLVAMATLSLVLPNFSISAPGPTFTTSQLAFAGVVSLVLYGTFVFVQAIRHRDYFLPPPDLPGDDRHAPAGSGAAAMGIHRDAVGAEQKASARRMWNQARAGVWVFMCLNRAYVRLRPLEPDCLARHG